MGVLGLLTSLRSNYITSKSFTKFDNNKILNINQLFIDFNSFIHMSMQEVLSEENKLLDKNKSLSFKMNEIDNKIVKRTIGRINIVKDDIIDNTKLTYLYIAMDGVPSKSKMVEQKERRFFGKLHELINDTIVEKYKKDLLNQRTEFKSFNRYIFEKKKIKWSRSNISPGTTFMKDISKILHQKSVVLKNNSEKLKYVFSDYTEVGEGEKKILDLIRKNKDLNNINNRIAIFSPDGDAILLYMLLDIQIYVIREDESGYEYIDIVKLKNDIFNYFIQINHNIIDSSKLNKKQFIHDLVFLFSFFGDDFISKLESFSVGFHLHYILLSYGKAIKNNNYAGLTTPNSIHQQIFIDILKNMVKYEKNALTESYLFSYYKSYGFIRKQYTKWYDTIYIKKLNRFGDLNIIDLLPKCIKLHDELMSTLRTNNTKMSEQQILQIIQKDKLSIIYASALVYCFINSPNNHDELLKQSYTMNTNFKLPQGIKYYILYFRENKELPRLNLPILKNTLEEDIRRDMKNAKRNRKEPSFEIKKVIEGSKYDIFKRSFLNMKDSMEFKWRQYLEVDEPEHLKLGKVDVPSMHNKYNYNSDKYSKGAIKYFYEKGFTTKNKDEIVKEYLMGIMWIHYYYSNIDIGLHLWHYKFDKSPLIIDILHFLEKNPLFDITKYTYNIYNKNRVKHVKDYFSPIEHLLYVTPYEDMDLLPKRTKILFKKEKKVFNRINYPNLKKIAYKIINKKKNQINCYKIRYLNKCRIRVMNKININDIEFRRLIKLNKIK